MDMGRLRGDEGRAEDSSRPIIGRKGLAEAGPAPPWKRNRLVTETEPIYLVQHI
jgi:hypothetical protein